MDQEFARLLRENADAQGRTAFHGKKGGEPGELVFGEGEKEIVYKVKPLSELYGQGSGREVDPLDHHFQPLFRAIESELVQCDRELHGKLSDGLVSVALARLGVTPDGDMENDRLATRVQVALRITLSVRDYSRPEVRQAIRRIARSVEHHTRDGGPRGYLNFIERSLR